MPKHFSKYLFEVLKVAVAGGLLYYLFRSGSLDLNALKLLLNPSTVGIGLAVMGVMLFLVSERWRILLRQQGLPAFPFETYKLSLIGNFFSFFVPGGVGGDVIKAVLIAKNHPSNKGKSVLTVLADRILGLFTMTLLAVCGFAFEPGILAEPSFRLILAFLGLLLLGFLFAFWLLLAGSAGPLRKVFDRLTLKIPRLHHLWQMAQGYKLSLGEWARILILSLAAQAMQIVLFVLVAQRLNIALPSLAVFFFAVPVGFMITAIPIAPAGIGIGQAAFLYLFSKALGQESNIGTVGVTAFQAFLLVYGLVGAVFFILLKSQNSRIEQGLANSNTATEPQN